MKRPPVGSDPELSGMQAFADGDHFKCLRENGKTIQVQATSLNDDLLLSYNAPTNIDYLSIDAEGSELDLLLSFDFERYRISLISVELTCPCRFPPRSVRVRPSEGRTDEESQVYGRADYRRTARA